jgi:hypothetical protein
LELNAAGLKVRDADNATVNSVCERLAVPGYVPTQGREGNLAAFSAERARVFNAAGSAAVKKWLAGTP